MAHALETHCLQLLAGGAAKKAHWLCAECTGHLPNSKHLWFARGSVEFRAELHSAAMASFERSLLIDARFAKAIKTLENLKALAVDRWGLWVVTLWAMTMSYCCCSIALLSVYSPPAPSSHNPRWHFRMLNDTVRKCVGRYIVRVNPCVCVCVSPIKPYPLPLRLFTSTRYQEAITSAVRQLQEANPGRPISVLDIGAGTGVMPYLMQTSISNSST